ncbi:hypothetical protein GE061_013896 [Apolygus lucorum]|uniref:Uncharacterized protein n=1 Tax=Apolygus lucorum TaxID=248454 RepID=A0A8S9XT42_APOLU|nr:hypothetical protein GE061_013896 [Apolygus lucorum]
MQIKQREMKEVISLTENYPEAAAAHMRKLVLYLTNQRRVKFSACGLFTLEYPLLTSIIAAATTYLTILLQFN